MTIISKNKMLHIFKINLKKLSHLQNNFKEIPISHVTLNSNTSVHDKPCGTPYTWSKITWQKKAMFMLVSS